MKRYHHRNRLFSGESDKFERVHLWIVRTFSVKIMRKLHEIQIGSLGVKPLKDNIVVASLSWGASKLEARDFSKPIVCHKILDVVKLTATFIRLKVGDLSLNEFKMLKDRTASS